jgi:ACS family hexuronate transporter-like MFS transporter
LSAAIFSNGNTIGAILAPPVISLLALRASWRAGFIVPAVAGVGLLWLWQKRYAAPKSDPRLTQGERELILADRITLPADAPRHSTWTLLTHPLYAGFFLLRFLTDPVTYFFAFWIPEYLSQSRGFSLAAIGLVAWIPFLASDIGGLGGGALSDLLVRRGRAPGQARRSVMLAAALAMPLAGAVVLVPKVWLAVALLALAFAAQSCWMANQLAMIAESAPQYDVGKVLAISALGGSLGGVLSTMAAGAVIAAYGYRPVFLVIGFLHFSGWLVLYASRRIENSHNRRMFAA